MDRILEIEDQIFNLAQVNVTSGFRSFLRSAINRKYRQLWDRYIWRDATVVHESWAFTSGDAEQILPKDVGRLLAITDTTNQKVLEPVNQRLFQLLSIGESTTEGPPMRFTAAGSTSCVAQPASAGVISVVSSDTSDVETVTLRGVVGGQNDYETVTLDGTTSVDTTKSFSRVDKVSKSGATVGIVTVTDALGTTMATMATGEVSPEHMKIRFHQIPTSQGLYITYMKRFRKLIADNDVPIMDCSDVLLQGGFVDALRQQKKWDQYRLENRELEKMMNRLELKDHKNDEIMRMVPNVHKPSMMRNQYG